MHGPGNVELAGSVGHLSAQVHGPGDLKGEALTCARAEVGVSGPGNAEVRVKDPNSGAVRLANFDHKGMHTR